MGLGLTNKAFKLRVSLSNKKCRLFKTVQNNEGKDIVNKKYPKNTPIPFFFLPNLPPPPSGPPVPVFYTFWCGKLPLYNELMNE